MEELGFSGIEIMAMELEDIPSISYCIKNKFRNHSIFSKWSCKDKLLEICHDEDVCWKKMKTYWFSSEVSCKVKWLKSITKIPNNVIFIDKEEDVKMYVDQIRVYKVISIDCEGVNLGRSGTISLIQIATGNRVYIFDVTTLKERVFELGLKDILESDDIIKVLYDARADCDALWNIYKILLSNIIDLQVLCMEEVYDNERLIGLVGIIMRSIMLKEVRWKLITEKEAGKVIYNQLPNGFDTRPLPISLMYYAMMDVTIMMKLFEEFFFRINPNSDTLKEVSKQRAYNYAMKEKQQVGTMNRYIDWSYSICLSIDENKKEHKNMVLTEAELREIDFDYRYRTGY
jgi:exonuclease 3'-5' domain-containing protein 1